MSATLSPHQTYVWDNTFGTVQTYSLTVTGPANSSVLLNGTADCGTGTINIDGPALVGHGTVNLFGLSGGDEGNLHTTIDVGAVSLGETISFEDNVGYMFQHGNSAVLTLDKPGQFQGIINATDGILGNIDIPSIKNFDHATFTREVLQIYGQPVNAEQLNLWGPHGRHLDTLHITGTDNVVVSEQGPTPWMPKGGVHITDFHPASPLIPAPSGIVYGN